jgi:hypothetical protein
MSKTHNEDKLMKEILELSESSEWNKAKEEWKLKNIYFSENKQSCLCGHYPIKEICIIENKLNGITAEV